MCAMRLTKIPGLLLLFVLVYSAGAVADSSVITPAQTALHIGEQVTVKGRVVVVYTAPGGETYLNFGAEYPNQVFSVVVPADHADQFPKVHDLEGRVVRVSGVVKLHKGKPEIVVEQAKQLRE